MSCHDHLSEQWKPKLPMPMSDRPINTSANRRGAPAAIVAQAPYNPIRMTGTLVSVLTNSAMR
jgi:hypothetical protein